MSAIHHQSAKADSYTFAQRLVNFRMAQGLSVNALSHAIDVPAYTVRRWEAGASKPSEANAKALVALGMEPIAPEETNASSRSRRTAALRLLNDATAFKIDGLPNATAPSWIVNGPSDQEPFYRKLIDLQLQGMTDRGLELDRLSLVDHYSAGMKTSQSALESPKPMAASWNSNYGSHGWHRYIGRFPPHLVRALLNHFGANSETVVCDPFLGSGTTAVECRLLGIPFVGVEICSLSHLMGRVKAGFDPDNADLLSLSARYVSYMKTQTSSALESLPANYTAAHVLQMPGNVIPTFANYEKWFSPQALLGVSLTMSFGKLLTGFERDALHLALSAKMRSIGNLDVDVVRAEYSKRPRVNVDVASLVGAQLKKMSKDIANMVRTHPRTIGQAESVKILETSALEVNIEGSSIDFIITSPPYGVEAISYLRTHLLSYRSLSSVLSHDPYQTKEQTIGSEYLEEAKLPAVLTVAKASVTFRSYFENLAPAKDKNTRLRQLGMMKFFEDMHILGTRMSHWLKDSGKLAFVIGNKRLGETVVPTDKIIEESFLASGLEVYDVIRHKLKTNNSNSEVPWQERIIQEEATMLFRKVRVL